MALQFAWSFKGTDYPTAYAKVKQTNIAHGKDAGGNLTFNLFASKAARDASEDYFLDQKSYSVSAAEYAEFLSAPAINPLDNNPQAQAYAFALQKLDVDTGARDADGTPILKCFFEGAATV